MVCGLVEEDVLDPVADHLPQIPAELDHVLEDQLQKLCQAEVVGRLHNLLNLFEDVEDLEEEFIGAGELSLKDAGDVLRSSRWKGKYLRVKTRLSYFSSCILTLVSKIF